MNARSGGQIALGVLFWLAAAALYFRPGLLWNVTEVSAALGLAGTNIILTGLNRKFISIFGADAYFDLRIGLTVAAAACFWIYVYQASGLLGTLLVPLLLIGLIVTASAAMRVKSLVALRRQYRKARR